jgi:transposase
MQSFRASMLIPRGFLADEAVNDLTGTLITVRSASATSRCPACGAVSGRIHSRYSRRLSDLPIAGGRVRLLLLARRFHCDAVLCARLDYIVHHLALALGGRPAASFARRLMLPVSNNTLLRLVRRRGTPHFHAPTVVGIDDWAWRRNQRYGTIICDLERRKTIALLPDREPATAQAWLSGQPQIAVVARDRGGGYALAAQKALPQAIQVADRWHLMENASHAFLDAVRKSMRQIRVAIGAAKVDPDLLTAAETIQYEGYLRREETNAVILGLAKDGVTIKEIVRRTGYSRGLGRKVLRGQRSDIFRVRESSLRRAHGANRSAPNRSVKMRRTLEVHLPWLDAQWAIGHRNGAELWRQLKQQGFRGCLRVVTEWAARRRQADRADISALSRTPSARTIARLMTIGRDRLSKSETVVVAAIEAGVPLLVGAREVIAEFQAMIRRRSLADLDPWLARANLGLIAPFANGIIKDKAASPTCCRPASSAQPKEPRHQNCVRALIPCRFTRCSTRRSTIRRATDFKSSAWGMLPKEAATDYPSS